MSDLDNNISKQKNLGWTIGLGGGLIMSFINLAVFFMLGEDTRGDLCVWLCIQLPVYFIVGRMAAQRQADLQRYTYEPSKGVRGSGIGAALVTSLMVWFYIIVRGIVRDAMGMFIIIEPIGFMISVIVDVLLALAIGSWAAHSVAVPDGYDIDF